MRRLLAAPLLLAAFAGVTLDPPPADAQDKPIPDSFTTADGVRLKGLFHQSPKAADQNNAVVVLLYPPGPEKSMLKGDWDGLIAKLTDAGFHVFRFDWRGHGESTEIVDTVGDMINPFNGFWVNRVTGGLNQRFVKGWGRRPIKNDIRVKTDVSGPGYFPVYANDLAAVRFHLDQKNDQNKVNTSSIYLVGAGDTAALAMMWLAAEWERPAVAPRLDPPAFPPGTQYKVVPTRGVIADPPAGDDVVGAVWLSGARPAVIPEATVQAWVRSAIRIRDNNNMVFLYGGDDPVGKRESAALFDRVLVGDGSKALGLNPIKQSTQFPIPKTKLSGVAMLGQKLDPLPETKVLEYLSAWQKTRVNRAQKPRSYATPYYVDVNYYMTLR